MSTLQVLLFSLVQGITELFPVSSVAHGVLTPWLFGWQLDPAFLRDHFLPFVVMLHLGTAIALLAFFWWDWRDFLFGLFDSRAVESRRTLFLILVATIPAALIGLVFEKLLRGIFASVTSTAVFLLLNGLLLFVGERERGGGTRNIADLSVWEATFIGFMQSLALLPGLSRSGASMVAGFWTGLTHAEAARFSMLLATPIIAGAAVLEFPKLLHAQSEGLLSSALLGGVASGVCAFVAVWALMRWFSRHEVNAMRPFAIYCIALGGLVLLM